jgi:hypothetical protein
MFVQLEDLCKKPIKRSVPFNFHEFQSEKVHYIKLGFAMLCTASGNVECGMQNIE